MTTQNKIELQFADGAYWFALPLAQIDELQRKCGAGIGTIFSRVMRGASRIGDDIILAPGSSDFYALDLIETIRQGLIGGGLGTVNGQEVRVSPPLADRLITNYVLTQPMVRSWEQAISILAAVIVGYERPETPGKKESAAASETPTPEPKKDGSTSRKRSRTAR